MAHIIPSDYMTVDYSSEHRGEIETLQRLQKKLSNDFTVFHSLHWSNERDRFTTFGEIDFVIVNRSGAMLIIEQKNGDLDETIEGLVKRYRNGDCKNVAQQIHRNHDNLRKKLRFYFGKHGDHHVDYLVYLPEHRVVKLNAAGLASSRIVDQPKAGELAARITKILGPGEPTDPEYTRSILNFFHQTFEVVPAVSSYVSSQKKTYTRMREGLADVVENIHFEPFRLRVEGTAGCGKSQLTMRFFDRWQAQGKKTLMLCFNNALGISLQSVSGDIKNVGTFHDFCVKAARRSGIQINWNRNAEPGFWAGILDSVIELEISDDDKYDCLIVDEGQDFVDEWYERLQLFLHKDADVLWLEDPQQNLQSTPLVRLDKFVTYQEKTNYRTPTIISDFIKRTLGVEYKQKNPLPGLGVAVHEYESESDQRTVIAKRVYDLTQKGFNKADIVIISCIGFKNSVLHDQDKVGNFKIERFTGEYIDGKQIYTKGEIFFDTIFRFKGRQAPVVIVTDIHEGMKDNDWVRRVLYCAMTRATVRLELVMSKNSVFRKMFQNAL